MNEFSLFGQAGYAQTGMHGNASDTTCQHDSGLLTPSVSLRGASLPSYIFHLPL